LYQAKGMNAVEAQKLADKAFENPQTAIDAIITEELGIDKEELGGSAGSSSSIVCTFAIGAIIPLYPLCFRRKRCCFVKCRKQCCGALG
jgi:VIT1/CCC1 family predicted Fe2+/Mn2+ transporter